MREKVEVSAKTKDEAIEKALAELGTTRDMVNVRIIDEGSKGFLGIGAKDAKIVVTMKDELEIEAQKAIEAEKAEKEKKAQEKKALEEKAKEEAKKEVPVEELPKHEPVNVSQAEVIKKATNFVTELVRNMEVNCEVSSKIDDNGIRVVISGDDVGTVIGRRGETLDAIQYITNLFVNKGCHGDDYNRITVDTENYRAKREDTLARLAFGAASKVVKSKKDYAFEPMNPYERRIIHAALQNHKYVVTKSVGEDPNRRIIISLKK